MTAVDDLAVMNRKARALASNFAGKAAAAKTLGDDGYSITATGRFCDVVADILGSYPGITEFQHACIMAESARADAALGLAALYAAQLQTLEKEQKMKFRLFVVLALAAMVGGALFALSLSQ